MKLQNFSFNRTISALIIYCPPLFQSFFLFMLEDLVGRFTHNFAQSNLKWQTILGSALTSQFTIRPSYVHLSYFNYGISRNVHMFNNPFSGLGILLGCEIHIHQMYGTDCLNSPSLHNSLYDRHTVALDCYGPPKMLILVFIKFRENQE